MRIADFLKQQTKTNKMTKTILQSLGAFIVFYLAIAFATAEIDFRKWHELIRWCFAYISLCAGLFFHIQNKPTK